VLFGVCRQFRFTGSVHFEFTSRNSENEYTILYIVSVGFHGTLPDLPNKFRKIWMYTVEPGYNDIGLCDTRSVTSDILWY